jgi:23S rRNA (guanosine2251-2'-O)-methyltransferase
MMDTFGFTRKKWQTLSVPAQSRHLMAWLERFYRKLTTNRPSPEILRQFASQYNTILSWTGLPAVAFPEPGHIRLWIETVSDRIHIHRTASGLFPTDGDLHEKVTVDDRPAPETGSRPDCHIALDGIRSLFNVGAVFRICDAAGFTSVILGNTLGKEEKRVRKTAMGAHEWVAQETTCDLYTTLSAKKKEGYRIIGIETMKGARPYDKIDWSPKTIVVLGNEEYGISSHTLPVCDAFVYIPMYGRKNSINVACAASIVCFHMAQTLAAQQ